MRDIEERTYRFATRIIKMVRSMPRDLAAQVLARQLARSGSSIGANVEEAQSSQSKVEFARKMNIALSEARETRYWLKLTAAAAILPEKRLVAITRESDEIAKILGAIVKKCRNPTAT